MIYHRLGNEKATEQSNAPVQISQAMIRVEEIQSTLGNGHPFFTKALIRSNVTSSCWMGLPVPFCKSFLPTHDSWLVAEDENGEQYDVKFIANRFGLSAGWRRFAAGHKLLEGDVLIFQLIDSRKFKIYIVRTNDSKDVDAAVNVIKQDAPAEHIIPVEDKKDEVMTSKSIPTSENERPETSSPDRNNKNDTRSKDRGRPCEKERELERYEREREQERIEREREREYKIHEGERRYQACLKEWEKRENEKERARKQEREREKDREQDRKYEILDQENDYNYSKKRKYGNNGEEVEERKRRLREKEDNDDKIKELREIAQLQRKGEQKHALEILSADNTDNGIDIAMLIDGSLMETRNKAVDHQSTDNEMDHGNETGAYTATVKTCSKSKGRKHWSSLFLTMVKNKHKRVKKCSKSKRRNRWSSFFLTMLKKKHKRSKPQAQPSSHPMDLSVVNSQVQEVKTFKDFHIMVNTQCIDPELSEQTRMNYYNLCIGKNKILHDGVCEGLYHELVAGMIDVTINIANRIKKCKLTTRKEEFHVWDSSLNAFELTGFEVGFLRDRVRTLAKLAFEYEDAKRYVEGKEKAERYEIEFQKIVDAPW